MIRVVLVRTQGPSNAGLALRAAENFGPAEFVLVAPKRPDLLRDPQFANASHGVDAPRDKVRIVATLAEALADCTRAVGFTARFRQHREVVDFWSRRDDLRRAANDEGGRLALVFGNEAQGLDAAETDLVQELVWIPTTTLHTSLNLAACASIALAALFDAGTARGNAAARALRRTKKGRPASGTDRERLVERLSSALGGLVTSAAARRDLVQSIERVFRHAPLETRDGRAWLLLARALARTRRD